VTRLAPYGAFVDVGVEREGMLHVSEMGDGYVADPSKYVRPGETITVRVVAVDSRRHRIDLSLKPEPAPEPAPVVAPSPAPQAVQEPMKVDSPEEDAPTYMEMALRRAMERRERRDRQERKRKERQAYREEQEDILSRTLDRHRLEV